MLFGREEASHIGSKSGKWSGERKPLNCGVQSLGIHVVYNLTHLVCDLQFGPDMR